MSNPDKLQCYCSIVPGLETALLQELQSQNLVGHLQKGGVYCTISIEQLPILCALRTPTSIQWQVINGQACRSLSDFRQKLNSIAWAEYFPQGAQVQIQVTCKESKLQRSDILMDKAQRFFQVVLKSTKEGPLLPLVIRIRNNQMWVGVRLHKGLLHKRGWRQEQVRTPLRENWAMCLLEMANWQVGTPLIDPFCGSGTIAIEAALKAQGRPPFFQNPFLMQDWGWNLSFSSKQPISKSISAIYAADKDANSVQKAQRNAKNAGVEVHFAVQDIKEGHSIAPTEPTGIILCNPPYGKKSGRNTDAVYHWLGKWHQEHYPDWPLYFLTTDVHKSKLVNPQVEIVGQFSNGGLLVYIAKV